MGAANSACCNGNADVTFAGMSAEKGRDGKLKPTAPLFLLNNSAFMKRCASAFGRIFFAVGTRRLFPPRNTKTDAPFFDSDCGSWVASCAAQVRHLRALSRFAVPPKIRQFMSKTGVKSIPDS